MIIPALVSTYPPRNCGLATFASDLRTSILRAQPRVDVVSVTRSAGSHAPSPEVLFEIRQDILRDYEAAADCLNASDVDVACLQHEFGIFGGYAGDYILQFLERLRKPVVTVLHTVFPDRDPDRRDTFQRIAARSDRIVVLNRTAEALMDREYDVDMRKVSVIPHGVPDVPFIDPNEVKSELGLENRTVLLTFGLLSPGKGIEFMLDALPAVVADHQDVLYVILGATHPEVKRNEGEAYRESLIARVEAARLCDNVRFIDQFVDLHTLCRYLQACDVYVAPHRGKEQVSSGTLAYAVGAGRPVVASSFLHALELLDEGRGQVVGYGDVQALAEGLLMYVEQPELRRDVGRRAYEYTREMTWPRLGERYVELFEQARSDPQRSVRKASLGSGDGIEHPQTVSPGLMRPTLAYLESLTDENGIFQHAPFGIPDRRHGYCTDDVTRALIAVLRHAGTGSTEPPEATIDGLMRTYLAFLVQAQREDGVFRNVMRFDRSFVDGTATQDTQGRAVWALATATVHAARQSWRVLTYRMLVSALGHPLTHPRAIAYEIIGLAELLRATPGLTRIRRRMEADADELMRIYQASDWRWFGDEITYANAVIPDALLHASSVCGRADYRRIGVESLEFLIDITYRDELFDFVGNQGWFVRGGSRAEFGQQPIEAGYTAAACVTAFRLTGELKYLRWANAAAEWFVGRNRLGLPLYDAATGLCADGLEADGVSQNAGAESSIVCQIGLQAVTAVRGASSRSSQREAASRRGAAGTAGMAAAAKFRETGAKASREQDEASPPKGTGVRQIIR